MDPIIYDFDKRELRKLRLFFCDIDGTLIDSNLHIGKFTEDKVIELSQKIPFLLTSGRTYRGLIPFHEQLNLDTPYITLNGAAIIDGKNIIDSVPLPEKEAKEILCFLANHFSNDSINIFSLKEWYSNATDNIYVQRENEILNFWPDRIFNMKKTENVVYSKILFIGPVEDCNKVTEWCQRFQDTIYVIHNSPTYVEFFSKKASKGNAIKAYCRKNDCPLENALGAGDALIDETMMRTCGFRASPSKANELIQSLSNIHLPSNENDAIGYLANDLLDLFK